MDQQPSPTPPQETASLRDHILPIGAGLVAAGAIAGYGVEALSNHGTEGFPTPAPVVADAPKSALVPNPIMGDQAPKNPIVTTDVLKPFMSKPAGTAPVPSEAVAPAAPVVSPSLVAPEASKPKPHDNAPKIAEKIADTTGQSIVQPPETATTQEINMGDSTSSSDPLSGYDSSEDTGYNANAPEQSPVDQFLTQYRADFFNPSVTKVRLSGEVMIATPKGNYVFDSPTVEHDQATDTTLFGVYYAKSPDGLGIVHLTGQDALKSVSIYNHNPQPLPQLVPFKGNVAPDSSGRRFQDVQGNLFGEQLFINQPSGTPVEDLVTNNGELSLVPIAAPEAQATQAAMAEARMLFKDPGAPKTYVNGILSIPALKGGPGQENHIYADDAILFHNSAYNGTVVIYANPTAADHLEMAYFPDDQLYQLNAYPHDSASSVNLVTISGDLQYGPDSSNQTNGSFTIGKLELGRKLFTTPALGQPYQISVDKGGNLATSLNNGVK